MCFKSYLTQFYEASAKIVENEYSNAQEINDRKWKCCWACLMRKFRNVEKNRDTLRRQSLYHTKNRFNSNLENLGNLKNLSIVFSINCQIKSQFLFEANVKDQTKTRKNDK